MDGRKLEDDYGDDDDDDRGGGDDGEKDDIKKIYKLNWELSI